MKELSYKIAKIKYRLFGRDKEVINDFFRKNGVKIGGGAIFVAIF